MTQEEEAMLDYIRKVDKFHDLLYGGIRVKAFQKLIVLDAHLRLKYPRGQNWLALKRWHREPGIRHNYENYLALAQVDKKEVDYVCEFLGVSDRTARDYLKTLYRLNNPVAYIY